MRFASIPFTVLIFGLLGGCALEPVAPWQRDRLAKPEMSWETDAALAGFRQHVYESKEAASGGVSLGGGGCGCK